MLQLKQSLELAKVYTYWFSLQRLWMWLLSFKSTFWHFAFEFIIWIILSWNFFLFKLLYVKTNRRAKHTFMILPFLPSGKVSFFINTSWKYGYLKSIHIIMINTDWTYKMFKKFDPYLHSQCIYLQLQATEHEKSLMLGKFFIKIR